MKYRISNNFFLCLSAVFTSLFLWGCSEPATTSCSFKQPNGQTIEYGCGEGFRCAANQAICISTLCGNGTVDEDEQCDDGNRQNGDGCSMDCKHETCGNGVLDAIRFDPDSGTYVRNEVCDPGIDAKCSDDCKSNLACGNGIVDPQEACDHGLGENSSVGTSECSADCTSDLTCGNGVLDTGYAYVPQALWEQCDKGDKDRGILAQFPAEYQSLSESGLARCTDDCKISYCGNGIQEEGEECDTRGVDTAVCTQKCKLSSCGDGYVNTASEDCDPGAPMTVGEGKEVTTHCHPVTCRLNTCGDGFIGYNTKFGYEEQCDPAHPDYENNLRCNRNTCLLNRCGDGFLGDSEKTDSEGKFITEECDDGEAGSAVCTRQCTRSSCGDGVTNPAAGEDCDPMENCASGSCFETPTCNFNCTTSSCGDSVTNQEAGEQCDSGKNGSRECTSTCQKSFCGDGIWNAKANEECDPGTPEGASSPVNEHNACAEGSLATSEATSCDTTIICNYDCTKSRCGDGILNMVNNVEECDEGAANLKPEILRFREALEEFCQSLNADTANERYLFTDDEGVKHSFCSGSGSAWTVSFAQEVQGDNKTLSSVRRRASAEYYYTHIYLNDERFHGRCHSDCTISQCGNGIIDVGEVCDGTQDGWEGAASACSDDCRSTKLCGNGVIDTSKNEVCDPPVNGCKACMSGLTCGNGTVETGEQCDTGPGTDNTGFCIITENLTSMDATWNRVLYMETPSENMSQSQCANASGRWDESDSKCYELRNCIKESVKEMCLTKSENWSPDCQTNEVLAGCYSGLAEQGEGASCSGENDELVTVCISKSCKLAYCGDGFLHLGKEECDHSQTKRLSSNDELCEECNQYDEGAAEKTECISQCLSRMRGLEEGEFCNYNCAKNICGDGLVNTFAGEVCDWGSQNGLTQCPNGAKTCQVCAQDCKSMVRVGCGDGFVNSEAPFNETCDHMESNSEGAICDETHKENCRSFSSPDQCLNYPCQVCEECSDEKIYHAVVSVGPDGMGLVTSDAIGFLCSSSSSNPSQCTAYTTLSAVTISAVPVEGYELQEWGGVSGDSHCTASGRTLTCSFDESFGKVSIAPVFKKVLYTVHASLSDSQAGTIEGRCTGGSSTCSCTSESLDSVSCEGENTDEISFTVTPAASADSGRYVFAKWMEGCPSVSYNANGRPVCSGAIGTGWTLTAVMDRQYLLTYRSADASMGTVTGSVASGTQLSAGTSVTLAAAPHSTYKFTGWTLSNGYTCQIAANNTPAALQNPCTLTLDAAKGDLSAEGAFLQNSPEILPSAVAVIGGVESEPISASYAFTCRCQAQGSSEWFDCNEGETAGAFTTIYGASCEIGYVANDPGGRYLFSTWTGCSSYTDTTCTLNQVVAETNPVKAIFAQNRHGIDFAASGLLAGESLSYQCALVTNGAAGTPGSCSGVYDQDATVRVYLDTSTSVCRSDKQIVFTADQASGESEITKTYTCGCDAQRHFVSCTAAGASSSESAFIDLSMSRDRVLSAALSNTSSLTLSSAARGTKKEQLNGSVTGQILGADESGDAPTTVFSCNAQSCFGAAVGKGSVISMTAAPNAGYRLTAWKVGEGSYLEASNGTYTLDTTAGTIRFTMTNDADVTPVFLPVLTAAVSPEEAGTVACMVTNCASGSSGTSCRMAAISDDSSLYNEYAQSITCGSAVSGANCALASCETPVSPQTSVSLTATLAGGYQMSGWSDSEDLTESCSDATCIISGVTIPNSVVHNTALQTGSLNWNSTANTQEYAAFSYHRVVEKCKANNASDSDPGNNSNCDSSSTRKKIRFTSESVTQSNWSSNSYYLIAIPNSADRTVSLTCSGNKYRCVTNQASLDLNLQWTSGYTWYSDRRAAAWNTLQDAFDKTTGQCSKSYQYIQCLTQFNVGASAGASYNDITHSLSADCNTASSLVLSGSWQNTAGSSPKIITLHCGETQQVAQNASVILTASGVASGYSLVDWKLNNIAVGNCNNKTSCDFTMPETDSDIAPVIVPNDSSLATVANPASSGSFECAPYSNHSCGTFSACQETYTYGTSICVKAIPGDNMEFLSANNSAGCPVPGGWTSDGVCKGIDMSEDKTVSAVFSAKPIVEFSSNAAGCSISCKAPSCAAGAGSVRVVSGQDASFTAPVECGSSVGYEFILSNNTLTCPVATGGWISDPDDSTKVRCSVTNITQNKNVYAVYSVKPELTVTLEANPGGSLVSCDGSAATVSPGKTQHKAGSVVQVCAQPDNTHVLSLSQGCPSTSGWVEKSRADNSTYYECSVTMNSSQTVSPVFPALADVQLNILQVGEGTTQCAVIASNKSCSSVTEQQKSNCSAITYIPLNQKACIFAAGNANTQPAGCDVSSDVQGDGWLSSNICQVTNDGTSGQVMSAAIVFESIAVPVQPVAVAVSGQGSVACAAVASATQCKNVGSASFSADSCTTNITQSQHLCIKATGTAATEPSGCTSNQNNSSWDNTHALCNVTYQGTATTLATVSFVPKKMTVRVTNSTSLALGQLKCQVISTGVCPASGNSNYGACQSPYSLDQGENLCVLPIPAEGKILDAANSSCGGAVWSSGTCVIPFTAGGSADVTGVFTAPSALLSIMSVGSGTLECAKVAAASGSCADESLTKSSCDGFQSLAAGERICIFPTANTGFAPQGCQLSGASGEGDGWNASPQFCQATNTGSSAQTITALVTFVPVLTVNVSPETGLTASCAVVSANTACSDVENSSFQSGDCSSSMTSEQHLCIKAAGSASADPSGCSVNPARNNAVWMGTDSLCDVLFVSGTSEQTVSIGAAPKN